MNEEELKALAKECGAVTYTHRSSPHEAAVSFGPEGWAKFCAALAAQPGAVGWTHWESRIKQAIEALELLLNDPAQHYLDTRSRCKGDAALAALRSMPAEPVVWLPSVGDIWRDSTGTHEITAVDRDVLTTSPVVAADLATPHTAPLSDAEKLAIVNNHCLNVGDWTQNGMSVANAIERAVLGRGGEQ